MPSEGVALPKLSLDTIPEATFYIPATGQATRPRRALKHDNTFVVLDSHGDIGASAGGTVRPSPTQRNRASCQRSFGTSRNEPASGRSTTSPTCGWAGPRRRTGYAEA